SSSKRQRSTRSAFSEKIEKFVPGPSHVAPSGNGEPGQALIAYGFVGSRPASATVVVMARREARQGRAPLATDGKTKPVSAASTSVAPLMDGRRRVVIGSVSPEVDGGRFPVKRVAGEAVRVEADVFCDGHDIVSAVVLHRPAGTAAW